jgi:ribosome maturation factor RimP
MDEKDPFDDEPYTLEVSSPGVDRPLTLPRHWVRNTGRLVLVTLTNGKQITGRITGLEGEVVSLEQENKGRKSTQQLSLSEISKAIVQIEFSRVEAAELVPLLDDDADDADATADEADAADDTDELADEEEV